MREAREVTIPYLTLGLVKYSRALADCRFAAAALSGLVTMAPAYADDMACDDAGMMKMKTELDAMTDPAIAEKKGIAMKEMEIARKSLMDKKMDDCKMHMDSAMKTMMNG